MQNVPLVPTPSQTLQVVLNGQNCQIGIHLRGDYLYADVSVDDTSIVSTVICRDADPIICRNYAGFVGNLIFVDTQGSSDPFYTGLGDRFKLIYLNEDEYNEIVR